ncbi:MAG: TetR/AcrR family transcriptional regulator [Actinoplanes sp.]
MPRPSREQIDDEILEAAATLFARHGFKETSVQRIADAVGYSKTGLLHRYPSKESLQQAVVLRALREVREIGVRVADRPSGPDRDRAVLTGMARLALDLPGTVALLLSGLMSTPEDGIGLALDELAGVIFELFRADPETEPARCIRVVGALGALAVVAVAMQEKPAPGSLDDLIEVSYDALGHGRTTTH